MDRRIRVISKGSRVGWSIKSNLVRVNKIDKFEKIISW